tara:strand:+ start:624 stop:854 length:231 start_codon:yes stop_codon:yes gene_type:complete
LSGVVIDDMYFNRSDLFVYFKHGLAAFDKESVNLFSFPQMDISWSSDDQDSSSDSDSESDSDYVPSSSDNSESDNN